MRETKGREEDYATVDSDALDFFSLDVAASEEEVGGRDEAEPKMLVVVLVVVLG